MSAVATTAKFAVGVVIAFVLLHLIAPAFIALIVIGMLSSIAIASLRLQMAAERERRCKAIIEDVESRPLRMATRWEGR